MLKKRHNFSIVGARQKKINSYEKLRELILIEEFKNCLGTDIRTFVNDQKADKLMEAARLADNYSLTHKLSMGGKRSNQFVSSQDINNQPQFQKYIPPQKRVQGRYPENFNSNNRPRNEVPDFHRKQNFPFQSVVCNYCKRKGHTISECYAFKNKQPNGSKPTGFISSSGEKAKISSFIEEQPKQTFTNNNTNLKDQSHADPVMKIFQPFVYDARVSLSITSTASYSN